MLISFRNGNFLSFEGPVMFSLEDGCKTSRHEGYVVDISGVSVLRGAIVHGANASGNRNGHKSGAQFDLSKTARTMWRLSGL